MSDKQILWDQFGSYKEQIDVLKSQVAEIEQDRREWIDKSRKKIRDHLMPRTNCFYELILPSPVKQWTEPRPLSMTEQCLVSNSAPGTYYPVEEIKKFSFERCNECCLYGNNPAYYGWLHTRTFLFGDSITKMGDANSSRTIPLIRLKVTVE